MTEHWIVTASGTSLYTATDTVTYKTAGGRRPAPLVFTSFVKC